MTYDDLDDAVVDFLKSVPTDEQLEDFCEKHGAQKVFDSIQKKIEQVSNHKQDHDIEVKERLLTLGSDDDRQRDEIKLDHDIWLRGAIRFQRAMETARARVKRHMPEGTGKGPHLGKLYEKMEDLEADVAEVYELLERALDAVESITRAKTLAKPMPISGR